MKTSSSKLLLIISGAIIFNVIFWKEKMGINAVLFDIFICVSVFLLFPYSSKNRISKWLLAGNLVTAGMVVIQNTLLSKIAFSISLLLFISFSQYIHQSAWYAGGSAFLNYIQFIPNFFRELKDINNKKVNIAGWSRALRILLIPIVILSIFFMIYSFANAVFSNIFSIIVSAIDDWLAHFFDWFSFERLEFFLLGFFVVGGVMLRNRNTYFSDLDKKRQNNLLRKKNNLKKWKESSFADLMQVIIGKAAIGIMSLKNEYKIGTISLILLNLLLLLINVLDVKYVWLGFKINNNASLSATLHEGAGLLILSIVLAMLLLLIFFRGNLNFYKKNKWLKYGAFFWIFQNSFLVFSVLIRDYYYISHFGLAYKRVGLLFFLTMVLVGLFTIFLKIYYTKTTYYLLRINAWAAIIILVFASVINWDETIATYNLSRKSSVPVDVPFLLSLSNKTLPLLQQNKDVLGKSTANWFYYRDNFYKKNAISFFEYRKKQFLEEQSNYTWLSWNLTDAYVKKELVTPIPISTIKK
jgi:hypothetical protein